MIYFSFFCSKFKNISYETDKIIFYGLHTMCNFNIM